jgi:hypothetical protein
MTIRQKALETISRLPDDCTLEDVYRHLAANANQGLRDAIAEVDKIQSGMKLTPADGGRLLAAARAGEMYGHAAGK